MPTSRADATAPEAPRGIWRDARDFFRQGGRRDWGSLLGADDLAHFESRLDALAGPAATWIRRGRAALEPSLR